MSTLFKICILFLNVGWKISRLTFKVAAVQWMSLFWYMTIHCIYTGGRDSVVGPGIKSGDSEIFRKVQIGPDAQPVYFTIATGYFTRLKGPRHGAHNPPRSSDEVANRLEPP